MVSTLWAFIFQNTFLKSLLPLTLLRFSTAVWSISAHVSVLHDSLEWRVSASLYLKRTNKYIYKICYLYGLHKHFKSPLDYLFFSEGNTRVSYLCPDVRESERMKSAADFSNCYVREEFKMDTYEGKYGLFFGFSACSRITQFCFSLRDRRKSFYSCYFEVGVRGVCIFCFQEDEAEWWFAYLLYFSVQQFRRVFHLTAVYLCLAARPSGFQKQRVPVVDWLETCLEY